MNDIVKFDSNALKNRIAERIRGNFIELIPDEAFDAMVTAEIKAFTQIKNQGYSNQERYSDLQKMIKDELNILYKTMIKAKLNDPEFLKFVWRQDCGHDTAEGILANHLTKFMEENATQLFMNMFKPIISNLFHQVRANVQNF